jgi:radical SAM protein with 4Fe4S-binding SPASM domain
MKVVYIKPTDTCNLDCDHCFTSGSKGAKTAWDTQKVAGWVSELAQQFNDEHLHLELHGGEPFLRPIHEHWDFALTVKRLVGEERWDDISIGATTNLIYKLTDEHTNFFIKVMGSHVGTSWDPVYRFKTERMYQQWLGNLKTLRDMNITIKMFVTVTDQTLTYNVDELIKLWGTFGVTDVAIERLTSDGNAVDNPHMFPDNRAVDKFYYDLYFAYKRLKPNFTIGTLETIETKFETNQYNVDTNCRTCEQNLFTVDGAGNIGGCANGAKVESNGTLDDNLEEFLLSDGRTERIVDELDVNPNCLSCHLFDVCGGDCHRLIWQGNSCPGLRLLLSHFKYGETDIIPVLNVG